MNRFFNMPQVEAQADGKSFGEHLASMSRNLKDLRRQSWKSCEARLLALGVSLWGVRYLRDAAGLVPARLDVLQKVIERTSAGAAHAARAARGAKPVDPRGRANSNDVARLQRKIERYLKLHALHADWIGLGTEKVLAWAITRSCQHFLDRRMPDGLRRGDLRVQFSWQTGAEATQVYRQLTLMGRECCLRIYCHGIVPSVWNDFQTVCDAIKSLPVENCIPPALSANSLLAWLETLPAAERLRFVDEHRETFRVADFQGVPPKVTKRILDTEPLRDSAFEQRLFRIAYLMDASLCARIVQRCLECFDRVVEVGIPHRVAPWLSWFSLGHAGWLPRIVEKAAASARPWEWVDVLVRPTPAATESCFARIGSESRIIVVPSPKQQMGATWERTAAGWRKVELPTGFMLEELGFVDDVVVLHGAEADKPAALHWIWNQGWKSAEPSADFSAHWTVTNDVWTRSVPHVPARSMGSLFKKDPWPTDRLLTLIEAWFPRNAEPLRQLAKLQPRVFLSASFQSVLVQALMGNADSLPNYFATLVAPPAALVVPVIEAWGRLLSTVGPN